MVVMKIYNNFSNYGIIPNDIYDWALLIIYIHFYYVTLEVFDLRLDSINALAEAKIFGLTNSIS